MKLVLVRHGESEWNAKNLFTGWKDPDLSPAGIEEALTAGKLLASEGLIFDVAYTSVLVRSQTTCRYILDVLGQSPDVISDEALNERNYGDLAGLNKDDAREKWGDEQVHRWRRSYEERPPGGESLKDTGARVWRYYLTEILPRVLGGESVLVSAHGNSLRALVMVLDGLTESEVIDLNIATGAPVLYELNSDSTVSKKINISEDETK